LIFTWLVKTHYFSFSEYISDYLYISDYIYITEYQTRLSIKLTIWRCKIYFFSNISKNKTKRYLYESTYD